MAASVCTQQNRMSNPLGDRPGGAKQYEKTMRPKPIFSLRQHPRKGQNQKKLKRSAEKLCGGGGREAKTQRAGSRHWPVTLLNLPQFTGAVQSAIRSFDAGK